MPPRNTPGVGRDFAPNAAHGYDLDPSVTVESALLGRQVDVWREAESSALYARNADAQTVVIGHAPAPLWRYVVRGELSGCATSQAAARSEGERYAMKASRSTAAPRYALDGAGAAAERAAFAAHLAAMSATRAAAERAAFAAHLAAMRAPAVTDF